MDIPATLIASAIGGAIGTAVTLWAHRRQFLLEYRTETALKRLLNGSKWRLRTFKTIQYHVAGFEENELRKILIRTGAVRFQDSSGEEIWGLLERNKDLPDAEYDTGQN
ncbi:hypothetical protein [Pseudomonas fluorescens]|uniref:hypothetical protein n=1 Tax=Pseudomonas fluorescens TaxID=294 RepID=UPI001241AC62|nr:hypothetical protein [Pseudomonas fluorescens]